MTDMADENQRNARLWAEKVSPPYTSPGYIGTPSEIYNVARVILATIPAPAPTLADELRELGALLEEEGGAGAKSTVWARDLAARVEKIEQENQEQREWNLAVNEQAGILARERDEARADVKRLAATFKEHLKEPGHLPNPQIIRTVEELEALDPDTLLIPEGFVTPIRRQSMDNFGIRVSDSYHAVVVASGEHYRACREALEEA